MGLRDTRDLSSFEPRRGRDNMADRRITPQVSFGSIKFTKAVPIPIFRAPLTTVGSGQGASTPPGIKIIRASLIVDTAVAAANESFWSFQLVIIPSVSAGGAVGQQIGVNQVPVTTTPAGMTVNKPFDILADTGSTVNDAAGATVIPGRAATVPTQIMKGNDVLGLVVTKTGSPAVLSNLLVFVEYEVIGLTTTTSSSTTLTTSTTITTSSSSSTSITTSTSSTTSSSTTSTSTSSSSTTTISTSSSISTSSTTTISTSSTTTTTTTTTTTLSTTTTLT